MFGGIRVLKWTASLLILTWIGTWVVLWAIQDKLLFIRPNQSFDQCDRLEEFEGAAKAVRVLVPSTDSAKPTTLRYYEWAPKHTKPQSWFVHFHGNSGSACDRLVFVREVQKRNIPVRVAVVEYPGYANPEPDTTSGERPSSEMFFRYSTQIYDHLVSQQNLPVVVYGISLGTGTATFLASQRPAAALILEAPFFNLEQAAREQYPWVPVSWILRHRFPNDDGAARTKAKEVLILHGEADKKIPIIHAEKLIRAFSVPSRLVRFPGASHSGCERSNPQQYWDAFEGVANRVISQK